MEQEERAERHKQELEDAQEVAVGLQKRLDKLSAELQKTKSACRDMERKCSAWEMVRTYYIICYILLS